MTKRRFFIGLAFLLLSACAARGEKEEAVLSLANYAELLGWDQDDHGQALAAFVKGCEKTARKSPEWKETCTRARATDQNDPVAARAFFENAFDPWSVNSGEQGLFTGYYEASLNASPSPSGAFQTPIWAVPEDLITADLGAFKTDLKGQKLVGKIDGKKFIPYDDRAAIFSGALKGRAKPLLFTDDPVNAFFLEIQGSGRAFFAPEYALRIGYAAQNGHAYVAVGRVLADKGEIEKPVTMQKIRDWFLRNPERRQEIMNENPSVIFFRQIEGDGPVGAQGVVLTPMRSLAVDRRHIELGVPVWLESENHKRLVIAQDVGGAIKGPVRGDLFWGHGKAAEKGAGDMQERGRYFVLLPKNRP